MNNIDDTMQQLMQQRSEREEHEAYIDYIDKVKKPVTFRVDEMYIFISGVLCKEFDLTKGEFNRLMYENAILDAIDALGEDWKDYQKKFFESKMKQKGDK